MDEDDLTPEQRELLGQIRARKQLVVAAHRRKKSAANNTPTLPRRVNAQRTSTTQHMKAGCHPRWRSPYAHLYSHSRSRQHACTWLCQVSIKKCLTRTFILSDEMQHRRQSAIPLSRNRLPSQSITALVLAWQGPLVLQFMHCFKRRLHTEDGDSISMLSLRRPLWRGSA